jgi:DNA-binding Lrp family transcriptional regulator
MQLSAFDHQLIRWLQEDARQSTADLARKLKVSRTTIYTHLSRLETTGIIRGYSVRLSNELEAQAVKAHVLVTCAPRLARSVEGALKTIPEVKTVMSVSGPFDLIMVISALSVSELDQALDRIGALDGVERTTTSIILSTKLDR